MSSRTRFIASHAPVSVDRPAYSVEVRERIVEVVVDDDAVIAGRSTRRVRRSATSMATGRAGLRDRDPLAALDPIESRDRCVFASWMLTVVIGA